MKVRVYTDYDPVRILRGVSGKQFVEPTDALAEKMGLVGAFVEVDETDIPTDRKDRNEWSYNASEKKVKPDPLKVQEKADKVIASKAKKNAVLEKLKITESELADILKG